MPTVISALNGHHGCKDKTEQHLKAEHNVRERPEKRVHDQQEFPFQKFAQVIFFKFVLLIFLPGKGFDHAHAGQVFLQGGGKDGFLCLIIFVALRHFFKEPQGHQQDEWDHHDQTPNPVLR